MYFSSQAQPGDPSAPAEVFVPRDFKEGVTGGDQASGQLWSFSPKERALKLPILVILRQSLGSIDSLLPGNSLEMLPVGVGPRDLCLTRIP